MNITLNHSARCRLPEERKRLHRSFPVLQWTWKEEKCVPQVHLVQPNDRQGVFSDVIRSLNYRKMTDRPSPEWPIGHRLAPIWTWSIGCKADSVISEVLNDRTRHKFRLRRSFSVFPWTWRNEKTSLSVISEVLNDRTGYKPGLFGHSRDSYGTV